MASKTFILFACLAVFLIHAQAQINSEVPLAFPVNYIRLNDANYTLYFEFIDLTQTLLLGLDMPQSVDFMGVGFANAGNYGMHTFDIVAFVFTPNNLTGNVTYNTTVMDLYATEFGRPPTDVSLGGTSDYHLLEYHVTGERCQVLFYRKYNTGDIYDYIFNETVTENFVVMNWAFQNNSVYNLSYHGKNALTVYSPMYNGYQGAAQPYNNQTTFLEY